jgi:acyl dehydratase
MKPGDILPVEEKIFSATDLVMYAGATWDWHRLHHDKDFAQGMGLPAPVIDGQIYGALFAKQATTWLGPRWFVQKQKFRMRAMAFAGDTLRMEGEVGTVGSDGAVEIIQKITKGDIIVAEATTQVRLLP